MRRFVTSLCIFIAGVAAAQDQCGVKSESVKFDVFAGPGGLGMWIRAGGAAAHHVQIDTGSTGIVVGYMNIGGNPTPVPDELLKKWGVTNYILYNSSGHVMVGRWVYTSIELSDKTHSVTIPSLPVLSVFKTCRIAPGQFPPPQSCLAPPPQPLAKVDCQVTPTLPLCDLGMMGVGFDRGASMGTPAMNPFLHVPQMDARTPTMQRGYIITARKGITLGMTPLDIAGFKFLPLTSRGGDPDEWREAHGCVAITGGGISNPGQQVCGDILMDTGVDRMYLSYAKGFPTFNPPIPASGGELWNCTPPVSRVARPCRINGNASGAGVTVTWPETFTYSVSALAKFVWTGTNPELVSVHQTSSPLQNPGENVFVNTSRQLLYVADYLFDASCGRVGFRPIPSK